MADRIAWAAWLVAAALLPFEFPLLTLGPFVVSSVEMALGGALLGWAVALAQQRRRPTVPRRLVLATLLVLVVALLSALLAPVARGTALKFTLRLAVATLWGAAAADLGRTTARRWQGVAALLLGSSVAALLGIGEVTEWAPLLRALERFRPAPTLVGGQLRAGGPLVYATIAADIWALSLPLAVALATRQPRWWFATLLLAEALMLSLTRAGWLAALAGLGMLATLGWWQQGQPGWRHGLRQPAALAFGGLAVLIAAHLALLPTFQARLTSESGVGWLRASYAAPAELHLPPASAQTVAVTVRNEGRLSWESRGPRPFFLAYRLFDATGERLVVAEGTRSALPRKVQPGETVTLAAHLTVPSTAGDYLVRWEMVQEQTAWFSSEGSPPAESRLRVTTDAPRATPAPRSQMLPTTPAPPPPPIESSRRVLWPLAVRLWAENPLLGVGVNTFRHHWGRLAGLPTWDRAIHANNLYLETLSGTGLVGVLASLLWLAALWPSGRRAAAQALGAALLAALVGWYTHGLLDAFLEFTPTYALFAALVGLLVGEGRPLESP